MAKKKYQADPGGASLGAEVSTVNSYLYLTRPYPYNPDDVVRYGEPTWVFSATGGLSKEHKSLLENFMRDIQNKSGLILPDTIQAKTESPNVNAGMTYIPVLEYLDGLIRAALGMPSLIGASTTEGQTGSYSRSNTQWDMWQILLRYIRHDVEVNLNEQVVKPLIDMNYDITDGKYPQFRFKALTAEEKQAQFDSYINGVNANAITKTREDENFFRKRLEMPLLPEDHSVAGEPTPDQALRLVTGVRK